MNWEHLKAIVWLRRRVSANQWRRAGILNAIITSIFVVGLMATSVLLFFVALIGGSLVLIGNEVGPDALMFTWDVIVVAFLFFWLLGLMTELQRSEMLSLDRLLHLPLSLSGAFCLNYASSLLSLSVVVFLPGMLGLAIACVVAKGPAMLTIFPLLASFLLFVTGPTYQLRGWLATLMQNKRRRKTILVGITIAFILILQAPQFLNLAFMRSRGQRNLQRQQEELKAMMELTRQLQAHEISVAENSERMKELQARQPGNSAEASRQSYQQFVGYVVLGNQLVPFGWLPFGVRAAAAGNAIPGVLASLAMFGVGGLSLWRSYASTIRFYTGSSPAPKRGVTKSNADAARRLSNGVERKIPFLSEHVAAITLVGIRSLLRAPEAKMALLTPLILACVCGGMIAFGSGRTFQKQGFELAAPYIAIGIIGGTLFSLAQLMANIFGMDRGGFRAFVLMPVRRRDVLLGKNLSIAPFGGCIAIVLIVALYCVIGLRVAHLLATLVQLVPTFLMICLIGNAASMLAPMAIAGGSLKPAHNKLSVFFAQIFFMLCAPIALLPAFAALGAETLFAHVTGMQWLPIYLMCSLIEAGLMIWIYRAVIETQGEWLQTRESRILEILGEAPE